MKLIYSYISFAFLGSLMLLNSCIPKKEIKPKVGTYYFYPSTSTLGSITVTIDGVAIEYSTYTSYYDCTNSNVTKFSLSPGSHTYYASNSLSTYTWTGSIYINENQCSYAALSSSNGTYIGGSSGGGGSGVSSGTITDATGLKIELIWTLSPTSSNTTTYGDFDMKVYTSSGGTYDSQTNSSTFETSYLPLSGTSSNLSSGYYYVAVKPYLVASGYLAQYYIKVTGRNSGTTYTFYSSSYFSSSTASSSNSYSYFLQIYKSGNVYSISKY